MSNLVVRSKMDLQAQSTALVVSEACSGSLHMDTEDSNVTAGFYKPSKDKNYDVVRVENDPEVTEMNNRKNFVLIDNMF